MDIIRKIALFGFMFVSLITVQNSMNSASRLSTTGARGVGRAGARYLDVVPATTRVVPSMQFSSQGAPSARESLLGTPYTSRTLQPVRGITWQSTPRGGGVYTQPQQMGTFGRAAAALQRFKNPAGTRGFLSNLWETAEVQGGEPYGPKTVAEHRQQQENELFEQLSSEEPNFKQDYRIAKQQLDPEYERLITQTKTWEAERRGANTLKHKYEGMINSGKLTLGEEFFVRKKLADLEERFERIKEYDIFVEQGALGAEEAAFQMKEGIQSGAIRGRDTLPSPYRSYYDYAKDSEYGPEFEKLINKQEYLDPVITNAKKLTKKYEDILSKGNINPGTQLYLRERLEELESRLKEWEGRLERWNAEQEAKSQLQMALQRGIITKAEQLPPELKKHFDAGAAQFEPEFKRLVTDEQDVEKALQNIMTLKRAYQDLITASAKYPVYKWMGEPGGKMYLMEYLGNLNKAQSTLEPQVKQVREQRLEEQKARDAATKERMRAFFSKK